MKKPFYLVALLFAGLMYFAGAIASQEGQEEQQSMSPTGDELVAMCEEQYSVENYPDEDQRNSLIDTCINEKMNASDSSVEG